MVSNLFSTVSEFNKAYETIRSDILTRHGIKKGQRVRLKNAIALYQQFDGHWIKITSIKSDMVDRIKAYNNKGKFKLQALV